MVQSCEDEIRSVLTDRTADLRAAVSYPVVCIGGMKMRSQEVAMRTGDELVAHGLPHEWITQIGTYDLMHSGWS